MEELTGLGPATGHAAAPPSAATLDRVRPPVRRAMEGAGFKAMDTGDGCLAWFRRLNDMTHVMVSANNTLDGDPAAADWIAGRYGDRGGFVEVNGLTLAGALEAAEILRPPARVDGSLVEALYPSLQDAMDDLS
ncbi:hypothetical protein HL658_04290 [Azospirillum sp. RWY-5-1]|uniref:Uncharacterized protein n=1 Tax=Azospirillum oleiclasticum TaxID=2735135 RepID=A0ABX2T6Z1_9PROT|nr:hypothetical protein [Azospirillum oleiclasticum]NYZ11758.1 hypothetical protein [Azospirillum oleiclasticum]NYZ18918.1 hypothetical protein [Azospirillum oleiclasticum]